MGRTGSNHKSNRVESWKEQGQIMGRTGSNEPWAEQGRIMNRTGSNLESNTVVSLVEQGRIKSQKRSNHESNRVESWNEHGRIMGRSGSNEPWVEQGRIMNRTGSNYESNTVESSLEQGRIKSQIRSNHGSNKVQLWAGQRHLLQLQINLLNVQHISLDWNTNPKINIGSMKSLAWACSKVRSYPGWGVRCDFRLKLRRSNEHYCRTKSNHGTNSVESWVEQGR